MPKITSFTAEDLVILNTKYWDTMFLVEDRALEIARNLNKIDHTYAVNDADVHVKDADFFIAANFVQMGICDENEEPDTVHFEFPIEWLFTDNYITAEELAENKKKREEEAEYKEYLRLKAKFEKTDS